MTDFIVTSVCSECKKRNKVLEQLIDDCNQPPHCVNVNRIKELMRDL